MARFAKNAALYTDVLPEGDDVNTVDVPMRTTDYGLESDDRQIMLRGNFSHNSGRFGVAFFNDEDHGCLTARASVISLHAVGPREADPIEVEDGDFLEINGHVYQIRDNVRTSNPRLYPVAWS